MLLWGERRTCSFPIPFSKTSSCSSEHATRHPGWAKVTMKAPGDGVWCSDSVSSLTSPPSCVSEGTAVCLAGKKRMSGQINRACESTVTKMKFQHQGRDSEPRGSIYLEVIFLFTLPSPVSYLGHLVNFLFWLLYYSVIKFPFDSSLYILTLCWDFQSSYSLHECLHLPVKAHI